jgi:hypothetical protein
MLRRTFASLLLAAPPLFPAAAAADLTPVLLETFREMTQ